MAAKSTDDKTFTTFTTELLTNTDGYNFSEKIINQFFDVVISEGKKSSQFALKSNNNFDGETDLSSYLVNTVIKDTEAYINNTFSDLVYISTAFELPSAVKGVFNSVTSKIGSTIGMLKANAGTALDLIKQGASMKEVKEAFKSYQYFQKDLNRAKNLANSSLLSKNTQKVMKDAIDNVYNGNFSQRTAKAILDRKVNDDYYKAYAQIKNPKSESELLESLRNKYKDITKDITDIEDLKEFAIRSGCLKDLSNIISRENIIDAIAKQKLEELKYNMRSIEILKKLTAGNTNSAPLRLWRSEYGDITKTIDIDGKSLYDWIEECAKKGDYSELLNILNKGDSTYTFDRMAGTSVRRAWEGKTMWKIDAPTNTSHGFYVDAVNNFDYKDEFEWLIAEGTKVRINGAYIDDTGALILDSVIEATTSAGQTITKKATIAVGAVAAGSATTDANAQETPNTPQLPQEPVNVSTRETEQDIESTQGDGNTETIPNGKLSETLIDLGGDKKIKVDVITNGQGEVVNTEVNTLCQNGEIRPNDLVQAIGAIQGLVESGQMSKADGDAKIQALRGALANMLGDTEMAGVDYEQSIQHQIQGYGDNTIWVPDGKGGYASKQVSNEYKQALGNLIQAGMDLETANMLLDYLDDTNDYDAINKLANNFDINVKSDDVISLVQKAENQMKYELKQNLSNWIQNNCVNGNEYQAYLNLLDINSNTSLAQLEILYSALSSGAIVMEKVGDSDYGYLNFGVNPDYGKEMEQYISGYDEEGLIVYSDDWQFYQNIMADMQDDAARLAEAMEEWYSTPIAQRKDMPIADDYLGDYEDRIAYHQFNTSSLVTSLIL